MADYGTLMIANLKPGRRDAFLDAGQRWVLERKVPRVRGPRRARG